MHRESVVPNNGAGLHVNPLRLCPAQQGVGQNIVGFGLVGNVHGFERPNAMGAGHIGHGAIVLGHWVEGYPGANQWGVAHGPKGLVLMGGGFSAAGFLIQRLVLPQAHARHSQQLRGDACQTRMTRQLANLRMGFPEAHALDEALLIGVFFCHRSCIASAPTGHFVIHRRGVVGQFVCRQHVLCFDKTIASIVIDKLGGDDDGK